MKARTGFIFSLKANNSQNMSENDQNTHMKIVPEN